MKRRLLVVFAVALLLSGCGGGTTDDIFFDDGGEFTFELLAVDDEYSTFQNQPLAVSAFDGVLANDFICDCPDFDIDFPSQTASGGTLTGNDDGSFYYVPPQFFTGVDFFEYRIEDDFSSSVGRVRIGVNLPDSPIAVVDSLNGNDSTGSVNGGAFATIQQAVIAAGANGTIVVNPGNGNAYAGTVNLVAGQTLVGFDFQNVLPQALVRPTLSGSVNMASDCTVRGLTLDGGRIAASSAVNGEVSQCDFLNIPGYAIDLDGATGEWLVEDNLIENCGGGVSANLASTEQMELLFQFNSVADCTQSAVRLLASGSSDLIAGVFDNLFERNQTGFTLNAQASGSSTLCLDLEGNDNDDTYRLDGDGGLFQVEQLSILTTLNSGTVTQPGSPVTEVSDGFCGF